MIEPAYVALLLIGFVVGLVDELWFHVEQPRP